jgi:hypothetical protein
MEDCSTAAFVLRAHHHQQIDLVQNVSNEVPVDVGYDRELPKTVWSILESECQ